MIPLAEGLEIVLRSRGDAGVTLADRPFTLFDLSLYDPSAFRVFNEAADTLLAWLRAKQVTAVAPPNNINDSPIFDPAYWDVGEVNWAASAIKGQYNWPGLNGILVDARAIERLVAENAKPTSKISRETECRKWLEQQMRASPVLRHGEKQDYRDEANERFAGLGGNEFNRAWSAAITATGATAWRRAGRPKKSSR
jgi:hypothetical protein